MNKRQRLLVRWSVITTLVVVVVATIISIVARPPQDAVPAVGIGVEGVTNILDRRVGDRLVPLRFEDLTDALGLGFVHFQRPRQSLLPEDMGSGVAVGDYDGDGFADLYFVGFCGSLLPDGPPAAADCGSRLYRNVDGDVGA